MTRDGKPRKNRFLSICWYLCVVYIIAQILVEEQDEIFASVWSFTKFTGGSFIAAFCATGIVKAIVRAMRSAGEYFYFGDNKDNKTE